MLDVLAEYQRLKAYDAVTVALQGKEVVFEFRYCDQYSGERTNVERQSKRLELLRSLRTSRRREIVSLRDKRQALLDEVALIDEIFASTGGDQDVL